MKYENHLVKQKNNLKIIALVLLAGCIISCGSDDKADTKDSTPNTQTAEGTEVQTEEEAKPPIDRADYEGAEIYIQGFQVYYAPALYAEEENGDLYNDVLYQRIRNTEEYLNVDIVYDDSISCVDTAKIVGNSVAAADDGIQLVISHDMTGNGPLVSGNLCYDISAIDSVDLTREYWKFPTYDELTVNGHVYLSKPAFIIPSVGCITFNKQMLAEYDIPEPYDDVKNGKWTMDRFMELCKLATKDSNGDGTMDANDTYGYVSGADWQLNVFIYSLGSSITTLNENGKIALAMDTPHTVEIFEKLHDFFNLGNDVWLDGGIGMQDNRAMFVETTTNGLSGLRSCTVDYGILPFPKWDEAQASYNGYDISSFISIPSSVADPEMVGQTLEVLNFYSEELVLPAYYDIQLNSKSVRDEESIEMLDLIFNGIYCDAGRTYFGLDNTYMFNLVYSISHHLRPRSTGDFASFYAKNAKGAQKCLDKFYETLDEIES